jgi:CRISPR-associated protein Csb1
MTDALAASPRLITHARLEPVLGSTFQPTGFPDLGAATFQRPNGTGQTSTSLLVESVQSMTNHCEALGWDAAAKRPRAPLEALPYVEVVDDDGAFLTSSRLEPHRLASAYVREATIDGKPGKQWVGERLGLRKGKPLDWPEIYRAVFELDPVCLLHGVFFSDKEWHGNPRVRRALSTVVEAHNVQEAVSGGLKRDDVQFTSDKQSGRGAEEGYGFVPFGRVEYVAETIELTAVLDLEQIRGYGLDDDATQLLILVALWQLRTLLARPLRLRTACDLAVESIEIRRPDGFELPSVEELERAIARTKATFEHPGARRLTWAPKTTSRKKASATEPAAA